MIFIIFMSLQPNRPAWDDDVVGTFLVHLQAYPKLYDKSNPNYKVSHITKKVKEELAKFMSSKSENLYSIL